MPGKVKGVLNAPSSKSAFIRIAAASMLSELETSITYSSDCDDIIASLEILKKFGCEIKKIDKDSNNTTLKIRGLSDFEKAYSSSINCFESALCLRLFSIISSLLNSEINFNGTGSLLKRNHNDAISLFKSLGVTFNSKNGYLPFKIKGPIINSVIKISSKESSQYLTGLLFTLPKLKFDSEIFVEDLVSKPYIDLTLDILNKFGIKIINENYKRFLIQGNQFFSNNELIVEGDWSSAANMMVAAAIAGEITFNGLSINSKQADRRIIDLLKEIGADINISGNFIQVKKNNLKSFNFDASNSPDLFPILVSLAVNCKGESIIHGLNRLYNKESNRAEIIISEFSKIGANLKIEGNSLIVLKSKIHFGIVDSNNDHRIAMALTIAGLKSQDGLEIMNWNCVSKSYKSFFEDLENITVK